MVTNIVSSRRIRIWLCWFIWITKFWNVQMYVIQQRYRSDRSLSMNNCNIKSIIFLFCSKKLINILGLCLSWRHQIIFMRRFNILHIDSTIWSIRNFLMSSYIPQKMIPGWNLETRYRWWMVLIWHLFHFRALSYVDKIIQYYKYRFDNVMCSDSPDDEEIHVELARIH
jgi:hypothetical protein